MKGEVTGAWRRLVRAFSTLDVPALATSDSRRAKGIRFHLKARSLRSPFVAWDLSVRRPTGHATQVSRRQIYRRLSEWRRTGTLAPVGRESKRLPFDRGKRASMPQRFDRDRRGRPAEQYRFVDPLVPRPRFDVRQAPAVMEMLREPCTVEFLVAPLVWSLRLLTTRGGRDFLRNHVAPAIPEDSRKMLLQAVDAFEPIAPELARRLPEDLGARYRQQLIENLPKLAAVLGRAVPSGKAEPGQDPP